MVSMIVDMTLSDRPNEPVIFFSPVGGYVPPLVIDVI